MDEATNSITKGFPCELLYADDLVLTAKSQVKVVEMSESWISAMELRGLKINVIKSKLMISAKKIKHQHQQDSIHAIYAIVVLVSTPPNV